MGSHLDNFKITDITGKAVQLSDYSGNTVLINPWVTCCPPCRAEMPDLNAYFQAHKDKGFVILAINAGDSASEAAAFASQKSLTSLILLDSQATLLTSMGIQGFPTSILVGSDGVVKTIHVGIFIPAVLEAEITPYLPN